MAKNWDPLKDSIRCVEETRPVIPIERVQGFVSNTATILLEKLPDIELPLPSPHCFLPDMTPAPSLPPPGLATLWGIVTDADTGTPIEGIEVSLNGLTATTCVKGRYEFLNVEPGTYSLVFTDPLGRYETQEV